MKYFKEYDIFSFEEIQELETICNGVEFYDYTTDTGRKDNNRISADGLQPKITKFLKKFPIKCWGQFMNQKPNVIVEKHTDEIPSGWPLKTKLLTPLYHDNNVPLNFYNKNNEILASCNYQYGKSVLVNTQQLHGFKNNNYERHTFQVCFAENFDEIEKIL